MSFQMVLTAGPTIEMNDLLTILLFNHVAFQKAVSTALDGACSEAPASPGASVACYLRTKYIWILAVVESERKLI